MNQEKMTVREFLEGFQPVDWQAECLKDQEYTEEDWIYESERPFSD